MTPEQLQQLFQAAPEPQAPFFRLYHDEHGVPLFYSMEDRPGTYIEITLDEYRVNDSNVRVRDGKILQVTWQSSSKLTPSDTGTPCHPNNVAVVVNENQPNTKWSKKTYESS